MNPVSWLMVNVLESWICTGTDIFFLDSIHRQTQAEGFADLRRIHRLLCDGGKIVITTPDVEHHMREYVASDGPWGSLCRSVNELVAATRFLYDREALEALMIEAGFVDIERNPSDPGTLQMIGFKRSS